MKSITRRKFSGNIFCSNRQKLKPTLGQKINLASKRKLAIETKQIRTLSETIRKKASP